MPGDEIRRQLEGQLDAKRARVRQGAERWPTLATLMGAWFHQDWNVDGPTDAAVVQAYLRVTPAGEVEALLDEIRDYANAHPSSKPSVEELGAEYVWSHDHPTAEAWLATLARQAAEELANPE